MENKIILKIIILELKLYQVHHDYQNLMERLTHLANLKNYATVLLMGEGRKIVRRAKVLRMVILSHCRTEKGISTCPRVQLVWLL